MAAVDDRQQVRVPKIRGAAAYAEEVSARTNASPARILNPNGGPSYYQTRWWTRVELDPWRPQHEMVARRLVTPDQVMPTPCWSRKEVAGRPLNLAAQIDRQRPFLAVTALTRPSSPQRLGGRDHWPARAGSIASRRHPAGRSW